LPKLYLDDLKVGDEFRSDEFEVTENAIRAFAAISTPTPHANPSSKVLPRAAGIPQRSPCG
jgi:hypothetical protein